ncbi:MAG: hypothetical protein JXA57_02950 [Armatimonadetes bacterium]|nr:hypothetical protein [Armatimonadota bacterium]
MRRKCLVLCALFTVAGVGVGLTREGAANGGRQTVVVGICTTDLVPLGVWGKHMGWQPIASSTEAEDLPADCTSPCTLFALGLPPRTVALADPIPDMPTLGGAWLAACGETTFASPSVRLLPNELDLRAHWIRETLKMTPHGFSYWPDHPDCKIVQNVEVDLDGDDRPERLLVVRGGTTYNTDLIAVGFVDADGSITKVEVLTDDAWIDYRLRSLRATVIAIADLNGDGYCEVALKININDGVIYEVHSLGKDGF